VSLKIFNIMKRYIFKNILLWKNGFFKKADVCVDEAEPENSCDKCSPGKGREVINGSGKMLLPGLVDIHFHGLDDIDASQADEKKLQLLEDRLLRKGVTGFLPSFYSLPFRMLEENLHFYRRYLAARKGRTSILGVNLEGPFLNTRQAGAHRKEFLTDFSDMKYISLVREFCDIIRVITVSPELENAKKYIRLFAGWNIRVMMGHTAATYAQAEEAVRAGVSGITHLYNRTTPFHQREVGVIGTAFLNDAVYTELIADGLHSSREALKIAFRNISPERLILVSDRVPHAKKRKIVRGHGALKGYIGESNSFAGGGSYLIDCLRFVVRKLGVDAGKAWLSVSSNPAAFLSRGRAGKIKTGCIVMDGSLKITNIMKYGEISCVE
jgi:N-acetylglucosamine-6-phosphate deacetylase